MTLSKLHNVLWAILSGFIGASLFGLLLHVVSVNAQDSRIVLKAHKFVVLNENNEPVGVLGATTGPGAPGLPYLSLEGMHGEGQIFVGLLGPGHVQVRLHGENGRGDAGLAVVGGSSGLLISDEKETTIQIVPRDVKAWRQIVEQSKDAAPKPPVMPKE